MTRTNYATVSKTISIKKVKAKHFANQAGLDRLQELLVKATSNPNAGQNFATTIKRAFKSLQECKEPILTQKDAVKLKYVGPAMARRICPQSTGAEAATSKPKAKTGKSLSKGGVKAGSDDSVPLSGDKDGVIRMNNPPQMGIPLVCPKPAIQSTTKSSALESSSAPMTTAKELAYTAAKEEAERLVLPPRGPWKVILLVDIRERKSKQVVSSCKQAGIPCEERQLAIGDMAWIARCIVPIGEDRFLEGEPTAVSSKKRKKKSDNDKYRTIEIMVGTIVERKEVSDLASSLFGTRYFEQRLRLSQCGLPQVLFLVEGNLASLTNCPAETLQMAMMETRINLGFQIVQTKHLTDTVSVLKTLHSRIVQRTFPDVFGKGPKSKNHGGASQVLPTFGGGNKRRGRGNRRASSLLELVFDRAPVPPFGSKRFITYPELKAKVELDRERGTRSVKAITLAMLKQIPTLSQKKCTAIANRYPTLNRLLEALSYPETINHTQSALERKQHPKKVVQDIEMDSGRRTIGPNSASEVYAACCTLRDGSTVACHTKHSKTLAGTNKKITSYLEIAGSFDNNENRKPPPNEATNIAEPLTSRSPPKKARMEYTSAIAKTKTLVQFRNSSDDSSPEEPTKTAVTRKHHLPNAAEPTKGLTSLEILTESKDYSSTKSANLRNFGFDSTLRRDQQQQETVDLLTPEPSPKPRISLPKHRKMDLSDWSDSSNDCSYSQRQKTLVNSKGVVDTKRDDSAGNDSEDAIANATSCINDRGKTRQLSASSHNSRLLTTHSTKELHVRHDSNLRRNISGQDTSKNARREIKATGQLYSLASSQDDSTSTCLSPNESLLSALPPRQTNQKKCQASDGPRHFRQTNQTGNPGKRESNEIVCLLDDSDEESNGNGAAEDVAHKACGDTASTLPGLGTASAFVTTTRGGALPSTQESLGGEDGSSEEDSEFGSSLRKRLDKIRGKDLQEVIELDSDSE